MFLHYEQLAKACGLVLPTDESAVPFLGQIRHLDRVTECASLFSQKEEQSPLVRHYCRSIWADTETHMLRSDVERLAFRLRREDNKEFNSRQSWAYVKGLLKEARFPHFEALAKRANFKPRNRDEYYVNALNKIGFCASHYSRRNAATSAVREFCHDWYQTGRQSLGLDYHVHYYAKHLMIGASPEETVAASQSVLDTVLQIQKE